MSEHLVFAQERPVEIRKHSAVWETRQVILDLGAIELSAAEIERLLDANGDNVEILSGDPVEGVPDEYEIELPSVDGSPKRTIPVGPKYDPDLVEQMRGVLEELARDIDDTGGITRDRDGNPCPQGNPDWTDLGYTYLKACQVLGRVPLEVADDGDADDDDDSENSP